MDAEAVYRQLGHLIQTMPNLAGAQYGAAELAWLGRAAAAVELTGDVVETTSFRHLADALAASPAGRFLNVTRLSAVLYRRFAVAELNAPASVQGAFIPVGGTFDTFAQLAKVIGAGNQDILVVDPYMDEKALTDFAPLAGLRVSVRVLCDGHYGKQYIPALKSGAAKWITQYQADRPLEVRVSTPRALHDRLVITDKSVVWVLSQSLKDFATRSPGSILRVDADIATLKVTAYDAMWQAASAI